MRILRSLAVSFVPFIVSLQVACTEQRLKVSKNGEMYRLELDGTPIYVERISPSGSGSPNIRNEKLGSVAGDQFALWEEQHGDDWKHVYTVGRNGRWSAARETSYTISLRSRRFVPPDLRSSASIAATATIVIVQALIPVQPLFLNAIVAQGGRPLRHLPSNAWLVNASPDVQEKIKGLSFVRAIVPYEATDRLHPTIAASTADNEHTDLYNVEAFTGGEEVQHAIADRILELGGLPGLSSRNLMERAQLTPAQARILAEHPSVLYIDFAKEQEIDMDQVRQASGADYIETVAGFTGQGVRAEVFDTGIRETHADFQHASILFHTRNDPDQSHGTSAFGITFGDGASRAEARGMLPDAQPIFASFYAVDPADLYAHTAELLTAPYYAVYQTRSFGSEPSIEYSTYSAQIDDILFNNDILITQSQSNNGTRYSRPEAWAKNVVSVGGLMHFRDLDFDHHCWCGQASIGPAEDGRIKPDLAHFYDLVLTVGAASDTAHVYFTGTSASTPVVGGHFGLFYEMWHNGIFGNPTGSTVFESRPHAATAKAMLINTARQWNFSGADHDRTRTHQGWGMPDLRNLYDLRDRIFVVDQSDVLGPLQSTVYRLTVDRNGAPLRATLVYKDPPGTTCALLHRINDLSLRVTSPSGVVYWGNNGLLTEMWSAAGGAEDHINTVENVFIESPEVGEWAIEVIATEINQDEHLETAEIDADYALVVSGVIRPTSPISAQTRNPLR